MATENAANTARDLFYKELFDKGVHGLQVAVEANGKSFCVIAHVPRSFKKQLPATLKISDGKSEVEVSLIVNKTDPFKPQ